MVEISWAGVRRQKMGYGVQQRPTNLTKEKETARKKKEEEKKMRETSETDAGGLWGVRVGGE